MAKGVLFMIGNKKAALFAAYLILFSVFNAVFPDTLWINYVMFGVGFGILIAEVKND